MSSSSSSSNNPPTQKDLDCAFLARDALFPLKIQRDGSHPQQFPAAEAIARARDEAMEHHSDRTASSFFPRGIVVVHNTSNFAEMQWNGQPDIDNARASVSVIPQLLSVRCQACRDGRQAFIERNRKTKEREIVLCTDKVLQRDYNPTKIPDQTPQSMVAVETALAHHVTMVGQELARERTTSSSSNNDDSSTISCPDLAAMRVQAAQAAECYYSRTKAIFGKSAPTEVKRGPALGHAGFSWYPEAVRDYLRDRCVRAVATQATATECGTREARQCVAEAMSKR